MFLISRQVDIYKLPKYSEKIITRTYVYECNEVYGYRNTVIYDENNIELIVCYAIGGFVDLTNSNLVRIPKSIIDGVKFDKKIEMNYLPRKIKFGNKNLKEIDRFKVKKYFIDDNNHVNNARYIDMVIDYVEDYYKRIRIEYRIPAKLGDTIIVNKENIEKIKNFKNDLIKREKERATAEKYARDVRLFAEYLSGRKMTKELSVEYKNRLKATRAPASVNAAVAGLNSFFAFCGRHDLKLKSLKFSRSSFADKEREMTAAEYNRLLSAAKEKSERLYLLMQTACSCGLRVSEIRFITCESLMIRSATVALKGRVRTVLLPGKLCKMLIKYAKKNKIKSGPVFITRTGRPLDRFYIWRSMKALCKKANVSEKKVFPHNLRHLFARTYYKVHKDLLRLSELLGHVSMNTTRIYTAESSDIHRTRIEMLGFLRE